MAVGEPRHYASTLGLLLKQVCRRIKKWELASNKIFSNRVILSVSWPFPFLFTTAYSATSFSELITIMSLIPHISHFLSQIFALRLYHSRASQVVWWLRSHLPIQETRVRFLIRNDPTCQRATKSMHHSYWACLLEPRSYNSWSLGISRDSSARREATAMRGPHE